MMGVLITAGLVIAPAAGASAMPSAATVRAPAWSTVPSPNRGAIINILNAVSCASASACVAVGGYTNSSGVTRPLVESWNGSSWSVVPSPSPHPADNFVFGVSCGSAAACTAVGQYINSHQVQRTLIESGPINGARAG